MKKRRKINFNFLVILGLLILLITHDYRIDDLKQRIETLEQKTETQFSDTLRLFEQGDNRRIWDSFNIWIMTRTQAELDAINRLSTIFIEEKINLDCVANAADFSMSKEHFVFFLNNGKSFRITPISLVCYDGLNVIDCNLLCG